MGQNDPSGQESAKFNITKGTILYIFIKIDDFSCTKQQILIQLIKT